MSESNRVNVLILEETSFGVPPSDLYFQEARFTSESLGHKKETVESDEIRDDRQVQDLVEVGIGADGDLNGEVTFATHDRFYEGALGGSFGTGSGVLVGGRSATKLQAVGASQKIIRDTGSWVVDGFAVNQYVRLRGFSNAVNNGVFKVSAVSATDLTLTGGTGTIVDEASAASRVVQGLPGQVCVGVNLSAVASSQTVHRASGSFVTDGFVIGQRVRLIGFSANSGTGKVTAVAASDLTLSMDGSALVDEGAAAGTSVFGAYLRDSTTKKSYYVEKQFVDASTYVAYSGLRVAKLSQEINAKSKVMLSVSFMGEKGVSADGSVTDGTTSANENKIIVAGANVGSIKEGGSAIAQAVKSLSWEVDNNTEEVTSIDSLSPTDITFGDSKITGKCSIYLKDRTHYAKFESNSASSLEHRLTDADGNIYHITFPNILYSNARPVAAGKNQQVMLDADFQATHDPTLGCQMQIDRLPA